MYKSIMTYEEIMKSLGCCIANTCDKCPLDVYNADINRCVEKLDRSTLNLIKQQQVEIERLNTIIRDGALSTNKTILEAVSEAINYFADRLKKERLVSSGYEILHEGTIDNLLEEILEENENDRA